MEIKKNPKVDLEKKRVLFLQIALVVTLLLVFARINTPKEIIKNFMIITNT